jgi:hypothetical protein
MNPIRTQISNLRHKQKILYFLLFSFATILVWLVVGLVTSRKKTGISSELQNLAKPLSPTLNREVLGSLEDKRSYTDNELSQFPVYQITVNKDGTQVVSIIGENPDATTGQLLNLLNQANNNPSASSNFPGGSTGNASDSGQVTPSPSVAASPTPVASPVASAAPSPSPAASSSPTP